MNKKSSTALFILMPIVAIGTWFFIKGYKTATDTITTVPPTMEGQMRPATVLDDAKWYKMAYQNSSANIKALLEKTPLNQDADMNNLVDYKNILNQANSENNLWVFCFAQEKIAEATKTDSAYMFAGNAFIEFSTTVRDNTMQAEYLLAKSKQLYQKAVAINPNNIMTNNSLAIAIIQLGQDPPMVGIGYIKKSLQLDSNDLSTNYIYAQMLKLSGQNEKAILVYNKLVFLQPSNAEHYFSLSELYGKTGEQAKAKEFLEKAKSLIKK